MEMRRSLLSTITADWLANRWPVADLAKFRMEGEGAGGEGGEGAGGEGQGDESELEKWKSLSRKHEDRAKANNAAAKERDQLKKQLEELEAKTLSDADKAIKDAEKVGFDRGRAETLQEVGGKLVEAKVEAAAAGRLEPEQLTTLLEGMNVAAFLTDTGEVDTAKVTKWVDGIAPKADEEGEGDKPPVIDLGQGARNGDRSKESLNGDPLVGALKSKLGMR